MIESRYAKKKYQYERIEYKNVSRETFLYLTNDISVGLKKKRKNIEYLLVGSGFDIETTCYNEHSYMYVWSFAFNNNIFANSNEITVIRGRTWEDFKKFIQSLNYYLGDKKLIVFVANLGYEFQFMRKHIDITDSFFREMRHPFYIESHNIIFMEALNFNGRSLKELAKNSCNTQKAVGDLDYSVIRNNQCDFSIDEDYYIDNDVIILSEFSKWYFEKFMINDFHFTPVSIQQYIRKCIKKEREKENEPLEIESAQPDEQLYHILMNKCFTGGHNHGNMKYVDEFLGKNKKMGSYDLTSIYPSNMLKRYMPYKFIECSPSLFNEYKDKCCCLILLTMYNIKNTTNHSVISQSKCDICISPRVDNGRILTSDKIQLWCTELDYDIFKKFYTFDEKIERLFCSKRIKLPEYCIKLMCDSYKLKHELKKKKLTYAFEKSIVNSNYGVYVTKRNEIEIKYDNEKDSFLIEKNSDSYYKGKRYKTTLPQWGVWITAHCRHILLTMLFEIETSNTRSEVVYDDTDSLKITYVDEVKYLFDEFNAKETQLNKEMCEYYNLDFEIFDDIGLFDFEGYINTFKVLRSKCYIYTDDNGFHQTIAGLKKNTLQHYAKNLHNKRKKINLMKELSFGFLLNNVESEKLTSIYDDESYRDIINGVEMSELSGVCLTDIPFEIKKSKITDVWLEMIYELKKKELLLEKR